MKIIYKYIGKLFSTSLFIDNLPQNMLVAMTIVRSYNFVRNLVYVGRY